MRILNAAVLLLSLPATAASAHRILITNDDGLTSNVRALYDELKAAGHDVIVSVPCSGQSGMGGAIKFLRPIGPISADCHNGAAQAGAPGFGPLTRAGFEKDWFYVDGTPVMATLYGIDVLARQRWGADPDLVLSGPNEGQNVGSIVISSGTVSNVQYAAARGIPAIALSAGVNTTDNTALANPRSKVIARLSMQLVNRLSRDASGRFSMPSGLSLNVNFPDEPASAPWRVTRFGSYNSYKVRFEVSGKPGETPQLGRIALDVDASAPRPDQENDEAYVNRKAITVSPMQVGYDAASPSGHSLTRKLKRMLR